MTLYMGAYFPALSCVRCTGTFYLVGTKHVKKNAKTILAVMVTDILSKSYSPETECKN